MSWTSKWASLGILIIILLDWGRVESTAETEPSNHLEIISASSHEVLSGDLTVSIVRSSDGRDDDPEISDSSDRNVSSNRIDGPFILKVLYLVNDISESIGEIYVEALTAADANISIAIPCGFFSRGGIYTLQLQYKSFDVPVEPAGFAGTQASRLVDVKWPKPSIFLESQNFATYPSKAAVATIKYKDIACRPSKNVPEAIYLLQLIYCGSTIVTCYPQNNSHAQVLYYEEVKGFASPKLVSFRCGLFGLPGNYAVRLTAANHNPDAPTTSVYIKVDWSEDYNFNVHARSIYPCEGAGGVSVLFQYPSCRLQGDRVRVYGRLRADVTSLASPSSLHYVTELRSLAGKHSLTFDCELFTEKYVEYCFVYVSQAITGAMADVKMSCVPTFPFQESDAAGWGPWSAWSPCSSSCFGGIRNRYRFCDNPPPQYGAKFCQGKAVETEFCNRVGGPDAPNSWNLEDCKNTVAATRPEIAAEVGVQCRCGCIVALKEETVRKMIAANTQACPGRSFWLLQAQSKFVIGLHLDQLQFPCPGQYFRVRDGDSLSGELLTDVAYDRTLQSSSTLISKGQNLLLEFFSDELTASGEACIGGFLAHAAVVQKQFIKSGNLTVVPFNSTATSAGKSQFFLRPAHLATAAILLIIFLVSLFLTLQFFVKYRKYRIAEDLDNSSDTSELVPGQSKTYSVTTSFSDLPSMIEVEAAEKEAPCEVEEQYNSTETLTGCNEGSNISSSTLKLRDAVETSSEKTITSARSTSSSKFLSVSNVIVHAQPEVKYAYPVKLRTLGSCSSNDENLARSNDDASVGEKKTISSSERRTRPGFTSDSKDSSSTSIISASTTSSALKTGKETKDRRNRERLLQRPNSDFSLTNQSSDTSLANPGDSELEFDYYDYNVANASAVPGSYLGMDPAFLVWIPPFESAEPQIEDLYPEQSSKRSSILNLNTEGAALTPSEYHRMKLSSLDELKINFDSDTSLKKEDRLASTSGFIKDENPETSRPRFVGKLLSNRRIFQDAATGFKSSSESLQSEQRGCVIPNRLESKAEEKRSKASLSENEELSNSERSSCEDKRRHRGHSNAKRIAKDKPRTSSTKDDRAEDELFREDSPRAKAKLNQKLKEESHSHSRRSQRSRVEEASLKDSANNKYKFIQSAQPYTSGKIESVNIPMTELSGSPLKSLVQVRRIDNREAEREKDVQSPDYGIEMAAKGEQDSFYGLLSDNNDIKFADDDDEYLDEPVNA